MGAYSSQVFTIPSLPKSLATRAVHPIISHIQCSHADYSQVNRHAIHKSLPTNNWLSLPRQCWFRRQLLLSLLSLSRKLLWLLLHQLSEQKLPMLTPPLRLPYIILNALPRLSCHSCQSIKAKGEYLITLCSQWIGGGLDNYDGFSILFLDAKGLRGV